MGTPRANWHLPELLDEDDGGQGVEEMGQVIDLRDIPTLNRELAYLIAQETTLYNDGVGCEIKERDDTTCNACPIRATDPAVRRSMLCDVGCRQEHVLTEMAVVRQRDGAAAVSA